MKKSKEMIVMLILTFIVIVSCQKDDASDDTPPSQRVIFTSSQVANNFIRINSVVTFADYSSGVIDRNWTFEGANIDESKKDVAKARFSNLGEFDVTLNQTFEEDAFAEGNLVGRELDTIIRVTVLDSIRTILSANYINLDGTLGDALTIEDDAENNVPAGRSVRYSIETTGNPQQIAWELEGGSPRTQTGEILQLDVAYRKLGVFDVAITASSIRPSGVNEEIIPNFVNVVPSSDPIVLVSVDGKLDGTLAMVFSKEVEPDSLIPSEFSVTIMHDGVAIPANISDITIDSEEGNVLLITLDDERVYFDDDVTVSYTGSSLLSTDPIPANTFSNIPMNSFEERANVLEDTGASTDPGFENSFNNDWEDGSSFFGLQTDATLTISTDRAHSGAQSALITASAGMTSLIHNSGNNFPMENSKSYRLGLWSYLETPINNTGGFAPELRFYFLEPIDFGLPGPVVLFSSTPLNQWVFSSLVIRNTRPAGAKEILMRILNEANGNDLRLYIDDLEFIQVDPRP